MTQEEKAKAYDEALERFKSFKERYYTRNTHFGDVIFDKNGEMQKDFEEIFPELFEDEDERIRKELLKGFKFCKKIDVGKKKGSSWAGTNLNMDEVIAWLEKQKEQKHPNGCFTCDEYKKGYEAGRLNGFTAGYNKAIKEQKPAEWSEEDEKMRNLAIEWAETMSGQFRFVDMDSTDFRKIVAWLKSLRPQPQGVYQQVVKGLRDMCDRYEQNGIFTDERARDFLGNVRVKCKDAIECAPILDEPSWKPSEEQMKALQNAVALTACDKELARLYNQLKAL